MNASFKTVLLAMAVSNVALAAPAVKDPTKYDCRVVVGYRVIDRGSKGQIKLPIYECPHKDKLAAGKCESHWLFGMRCKE